MPDSKIDTSNITELSSDVWRNAVVGKFYRPIKKPVTMRLDADVIHWLKSDGRGYQTKANQLLRTMMLTEARKQRVIRADLPENAYRAIRTKLLATRFDAADIPRVETPGVYALFLREHATVPEIHHGNLGLLYIGMTESGLAARNHFAASTSSFSSIRRTLGALLRGQLKLHVIPRGTGQSSTNTKNFCFSESSERRLTDWMERYLNYGFCEVGGNDVGKIERRLINELQPPLNLTGWHNPDAVRLRALRHACIEGASAAKSRKIS